MCLVEIPTVEDISNKKPKNLTLILDGISDPGNMGTIIRTADWYGIQDIICSPDCVDIYNPKVVQATMGSISRVRIHYTPLVDFLMDIAPSANIYGAYLDGENIYSMQLIKESYLIIGSESHGISDETGHLVKQRITIPNFRSFGSRSC